MCVGSVGRPRPRMKHPAEPTFGARKNCNVPCSKSNWTKSGNIVGHVEGDLFGERSGFGKVGEVFQGEGQSDLFFRE